MSQLLSCQYCNKEYTKNWSWIVCDTCTFRVCRKCLNKHKGQYALSGGFKCSKCQPGWLKNADPSKTIMLR